MRESSFFNVPIAALQNAPAPCLNKRFLYGTSGFRGVGDELSHVAYISGLLLSCLGRGCAGGTLTFGTMITASHNPAEQNGLKLVDPKGSMIRDNWENYFYQLVNAHILEESQSSDAIKTAGSYSTSASSESLSLNPAGDALCAIPNISNDEHSAVAQTTMAISSALTTIEDHAVRNNEISLPIGSSVRIVVGRDTRSSSLHLLEMFTKGAEAAGAEVVDLGVISTPQLHFLVERANTLQLLDNAIEEHLYSSFFENQFQIFFSHLSSQNDTPPHPLNFLASSPVSPLRVAADSQIPSLPATEELSLHQNLSSLSLVTEGDPIGSILIDGSNGVGAMKLNAFTKVIETFTHSTVIIRNIGMEPEDTLNENCGADFVEKRKKYPRNFENISPYQKCVSVDGDGDRLVYFTAQPTHVSSSLDENASSSLEFVLLNGDRILALFTTVIFKLLETITEDPPTKEEKTVLTIGILQTGYANGNSTKFISILFDSLRTRSSHILVEMVCVKTGVKNFNRKSDQYDICLMFEANGHGTVITKFDILLKWATERNIQEKYNYTLLAAFLGLFNQAIGDAVTNILAVEASLCYLHFSMQDWIALYKDFPVVQKAIYLPREQLNTLKTHPETETRLMEPKALQDKLDFFVFIANDPNARAFVRSSGTEDICRIYCESSNLQRALQLTNSIENYIQEMFSSSPTETSNL